MGKMDLDSVTMDAIHNPMVQEILQKVEIIPDPELNQMYPEKFPAVVTIETNDGQSYTAERYYPCLLYTSEKKQAQKTRSQINLDFAPIMCCYFSYCYWSKGGKR